MNGFDITASEVFAGLDRERHIELAELITSKFGGLVKKPVADPFHVDHPELYRFPYDAWAHNALLDVARAEPLVRWHNASAGIQAWRNATWEAGKERFFRVVHEARFEMGLESSPLQRCCRCSNYTPLADWGRWNQCPKCGRHAS